MDIKGIAKNITPPLGYMWFGYFEEVLSKGNAGRTEVTLTVRDFNTGNAIHAPSGATLLRS